MRKYIKIYGETHRVFFKYPSKQEEARRKALAAMKHADPNFRHIYRMAGKALRVSDYDRI